MHLDELDYPLPDELIAQEPLAERDASRLLVVDGATGACEHRAFAELSALLEPSLIVFNNTKVIPARVHAVKPTGGKVEFLLIERLGGGGDSERWLAMGRSSKGLREGLIATVSDGALRLEVVGRRDGGQVEVEVTAHGGVRAAIDRFGAVPLPPYVTRAPVADDRTRYQTVYAKHEGAVAAPTAGLHFTKHLISALVDAGHETAEITLHVGPGTFRPVQVDDLGEHPMHEESYEIDEGAAAAIDRARASGRRVVAVGTTVVRALESAAGADGSVSPGRGRTKLFIKPPFTFRVIDDLITNFHLPRSTLLALVMAFASPEVIRAAYNEAILQRYRFYSYGDAMLIRGAR